MNSPSVFSFQGKHDVRIQTQNGEPWFCLKDVCEVLNIENSRDLMAKQLDRAGVDKIYVRSGGQQRQLQFVNEPNLYRVIFRSNKPEARQFQDWVFNEVLPSIRKTGAYQPPEQKPALFPKGPAFHGREPLNGEQKLLLAEIIGEIAGQFHFKRSWIAGIWHAIRRSTHTKSPEPLAVGDLPAIRVELRRIIAVSEQTKMVFDAIERDVIRQVIRMRMPAHSVFRQAGQYGKDSRFSMDLPAKLEVKVEALCAAVDERYPQTKKRLI